MLAVIKSGQIKALSEKLSKFSVSGKKPDYEERGKIKSLLLEADIFAAQNERHKNMKRYMDVRCLDLLMYSNLVLGATVCLLWFPFFRIPEFCSIFV